VEQLVNDTIERNSIVDAKEVPLRLAQEIYGVRAVFGEQYPDPVRVVSIGATVDELINDPENKKWYECSVEFCGGTHIKNCESAKHFVVSHEQALASGIRRIIALTGVAALASHAAGESFLQQIDESGRLDGDDLVGAYDMLVKQVDALSISQPMRHAAKQKLKSLHDRVKSIQKNVASTRKDHVLEQARVISELDLNVIVATINGGDKDSMMVALDAIRSKRPDGAVMLFSADNEEGKVIIVAGSSKTMISKGLKAGDWVRVAAIACGGGGGGRPDTAQAGGKNPENVPDAMDKATEFANEATA